MTRSHGTRAARRLAVGALLCLAFALTAGAGAAAAQRADARDDALAQAPVGGKVTADNGCYVRLPDIPQGVYGALGAYNENTGVLAVVGGAEKLSADLTHAHYGLYAIRLDGTMTAWNTVNYAASAGYLRDTNAGCREMTAVRLPNGNWVSIGGKGGCDGTTDKWGDMKELQVGAKADAMGVRWVPNSGVDRASLPTLLADGKFRLVRAFATYDSQRDRIVFGQGTYDDEKDTESQDKVYSATRQGSRWKVVQLRPTGTIPVRRFGTCAAYVYDKDTKVDGVLVLGGQEGGVTGTTSYKEVWWLDFSAGAHGEWRDITARFANMDEFGYRREGACAYDATTRAFYSWSGRANASIPDGASHSSGAWRVDLTALADANASLTWQRLAKDKLDDPKGRRQTAGIYDAKNKRMFVIGGRKDIDEYRDAWAFYPDVTGQACIDLDVYAPFRGQVVPTATTPAGPSATPGGGPTPNPTPTRLPTAPSDPKICEGIRSRVPGPVVSAALANPSAVAGDGMRCNPNLPPSSWNVTRQFLSLEIASKPYHPLYNAVVWKCGCP